MIGEDQLITEKETESTNIIAASVAPLCRSWTAVIAEKQTGGYGRFRRSFFSPESTGLYMSIVIKPSSALSSDLRLLSSVLTAAAGAASAAAAEKLFAKHTLLKWVNDIIIDGKKAGGILAEGRFDGNSLLWATVGIGVNIFPPPGGFPDEIKDKAGAVLNDIDRARIGTDRAVFARELLAGNIIYELKKRVDRLEQFPEAGKSELLNEYRSLTSWMNAKTVTVRQTRCGAGYPAEVIGVSDDFGLIIKKNGSAGTAVLDSGEVSVGITAL